WNGSQWGAPQMIPGAFTGVGLNLSATTTPDGNLQVALASASGGVRVLSFDGTTWSAPVTLDAAGTSPSLTVHGSERWCFYTNSAKDLVYRKTTSGVWDPAVAITHDGNNNISASTLPGSPDAVIPVIWTAGNGSPQYDVKAAAIPAGGVIAPANHPPVIDSVTAAPNPVPRLWTQLTATAHDNASSNDLTYSWTSNDPAHVSFDNSSSASPKATFTLAGDYTLSVSVQNPQGITAGSVLVHVVQTLSSITLTPNPASVPAHGTLQFSANALDQFQRPMAAQPAFLWSVSSGGGSMDAGGKLTGGSILGNTYSVTVSTSFTGSVKATAPLTITN